MSPLAQHLRVLIRSANDAGEPVARIEVDLIERAPLSDDDKSALWLYAWSARELGRRRGADQAARPHALG